MSMVSRIANLARRVARPRPSAKRAAPARTRPTLEGLESRLVPSRTPLDMAHVHLEAVYSGGALSVQVNDTTNNAIYQPSDVLLYVSAYAEQTQPAGYDFIGAGAGNTYWLLPQATDLNQLTVALSAEPIAPHTFDSYQPRDPRITRSGEWIKWSLVDVQGPGQVSLWQTAQAPSAWWASTVDGGRTYDPAAYVEAGNHTHYNWGFSAAGMYDVTFDVSAFVNGHGLPIHSGNVTFRFGVEVPLPVVNLSGTPDTNNYYTTFTHGGPGVHLTDPGATLTDGGAQNLTSLAIILANNNDGANEAVAVNEEILARAGLSATWGPNTATLTITGTASLSTYQDLLRTVTYTNNSTTPDRADRYFVFVATDDQGLNSFYSYTTVSIF
jgi:surface-anchored protein